MRNTYAINKIHSAPFFRTGTETENPVWDQLKPGVYKPKDENALSNYVKLHFEDDLKARAIIVGREVQIHQSQGAFGGQNTDIHVDAFTRDANGNVSDRITVIVETGMWIPRNEQEIVDAASNGSLEETVTFDAKLDVLLKASKRLEMSQHLQTLLVAF